MDRGVATAGRPQDQLGRQVRAEPAGTAVFLAIDLGQTFPGTEAAIALETLEPAPLEEQAAVEIAPGLERERLRVAVEANFGRWIGLGGRPVDESATALEVVDAEVRRLAAQHHLDRVGIAHQGRDPDCHSADGGHQHRPEESDVLEDGPSLDPGERHGHLSHRLQADHGREHRLIADDVVGQVRVRVGGQIGVNDQFDAGIVDQLPLEEPPQGQLGLLDRQGRRRPDPSRHHQRGRGRRPVKEAIQQSNALVRGNRRDPLTRQGVDAAEPLAHPHPRPDRPLQREASAARPLAAELLGQAGQPLVGEGIVGLAAQTGASDDRAERDE